MYRCFKLSLDLWSFNQNNSDFVEQCKKCGAELKDGLVKSFDVILQDAIDEHGVINGETFIDSWFPTDNYNVFLSFSHDDVELALLVAGFLIYHFGLKVFIDEVFWGSADQLLRNLDNKYCKNEKGTYDYDKRNFTTTHVHAMLATAIARTIDNSEIVIFLNSEKSVYNIGDEIDKKRTLSPWIYEEIFFTSIIEKRPWFEYRPEFRADDLTHFSKSMKVSYLLPDEHLIPLDYGDLCSWSKLWKDRQEIGHGRYGDFLLNDNEKIKHPLNVLYDFKCGYDD